MHQTAQKPVLTGIGGGSAATGDAKVANVGEVKSLLTLPIMLW